VLEEHGGVVDNATMSEFDGPSYDHDAEAKGGLPKGPAEFCRRVAANDAFVIASPEYNASLPGHLKNAIDWASRHRPQPFNGRHGLLLSASPSMGGGNRGAWALRVPFEHLGARVYPDMFSLAQADKAFDSAGRLANADLGSRLDRTITAFMELVDAAKHYPCAKKAWVEFLGERSNPLIDRVE
jgi:chromate reductase, NAD(P)H dehydrogenase (quinone)